MDVRIRRCWNGSPDLVSAALVDSKPGGQTTLSDLQGAAGHKRQNRGISNSLENTMSYVQQWRHLLVDDDKDDGFLRIKP
ncbi:jg23622 [Pararge aegeria aegeria]|uniref:Jg23622 protein n=1 Tax=Pararge aegeria aegeria TaxID=348720 RepID=A0A8S4SI08_9NEOP|nr:jg23622 [Pararge aegeria aegeria]